MADDAKDQKVDAKPRVDASWQKKVDAKDQKLKVQVANDAWAVDAVVQPGSFLPNPRLLVEPALIIGPKLTFA